MKLNIDLCGDSSRSRNGRNQSAWHKIFDAVLEPQTINVENEIIEYLYYHRHDLPRAVWIERYRKSASDFLSQNSGRKLTAK